MEWPHKDAAQKESKMPLPESKETTVPHTEEHSLIQQLTSMEEWRAAASAWPLKRLVALWNDLPGVAPVQKFTNREIALERIWRSVHGELRVPGRLAAASLCETPPFRRRPPANC